MSVLFADLPEAIDNTVEIAHALLLSIPRSVSRSCRASPARGDDADKAEVEELRRQAREGLEMRFEAAA